MVDVNHKQIKYSVQCFICNFAPYSAIAGWWIHIIRKTRIGYRQENHKNYIELQKPKPD